MIVSSVSSGPAAACFADFTFMLVACAASLVIGFLVHWVLVFRLLTRGRPPLPWFAQERLASHLGLEGLRSACARVDEAQRAHYATVLVATLHDLGGPRLLVPGSKDAFWGMIREAERRFRLAEDSEGGEKR